MRRRELWMRYIITIMIRQINFIGMRGLLFTVNGRHYVKLVPSILEAVCVMILVMSSGKIALKPARDYYDREKANWRKFVTNMQLKLDMEHIGNSEDFSGD